jgi:hypothetical protein
MNKKIVGLVSAVVVLSLSSIGFSHSAGISMNDPIKGPQGVSELVKLFPWVNAYFMNVSDHYCFAGDAKSFNQFMKQYASVQDTEHTLILHAGREMTGPIGAKETIPVDWRVSVHKVVKGMWHHRGKVHAEDPEHPYVVDVHLWLGGAIPLDHIEVPGEVTVISGGEIEEFISEHKRQRQRSREKTTDAQPEN